MAKRQGRAQPLRQLTRRGGWYGGRAAHLVVDVRSALGGASFPITHLRSLALSLHDQCHDAGNHYDEQDRTPYSAVSTHPAHAPPATIHHVSALRQSDATGQQRDRTNSQSE